MSYENVFSMKTVSL